MNTDPLFTEKQAALYLGNKEQPFYVSTLQRWRLSGQHIKYIKLGKSVRYRKSELDNFIENGVRTSTTDNGSANNA
jgi:predicted DNA-binding transcriptional regulator AlpA